MNKLTVQDVQKSFTDYVALVKQTCKTEKEDLKREMMTTNDNKMIKTMAKHIAKNEQLIKENKQLNEELDAINDRLFSEKTTKTKPNTKEVELTNIKSKQPWNSSTKLSSPIEYTAHTITKRDAAKPGGTRRRKKYRAHKRRTYKRTKR